MTDINIKELVEQQLIVGKLKKQSKVLRKSKPVFSLMQCQDIVAQQHGYLHWHELHTGLKRRLTNFTRTSQHNQLGFVKCNNLLLGKDSLLNQNIYLHPEFRKINIYNNGYSNDFMFELFKQTMNRQSKFIYCYTEENKKLKTDISNFAKQNNIPVYTLSFNENNIRNTLGININNMSASALTDLFVRMIVDSDEDLKASFISNIVSMGRALFMTLCYLRDIGEIELTPAFIRHSLSLYDFITFYNREDLPQHVHDSLKSFLFSLPGFNPDKNAYQQNYNVLTLHAHIMEKYFFTVIRMTNHNFVFDLSKLSVEEVLAKSEKFILMVDLCNSGNYKEDEASFFSMFFTIFKQSFSSNDNNTAFNNKNIPYYFLIENLYPNLTLPSKLLSYSINFLLTDRFQPEGININPAKNGIAVR